MALAVEAEWGIPTLTFVASFVGLIQDWSCLSTKLRTKLATKLGESDAPGLNPFRMGSSEAYGGR